MRLGASYKLKANPAAKVFKCVYVSDISTLGCCGLAVAVLKWAGGAEFGVDRDDWKNYEEVIEPRREFFNAFKMAYVTEFTGPYSSRIGSDQFPVNSGYFRYGVLELIHHSDNGTREGGSQKVESVFHMVKK